jgi:hypothetical protein
MKEDMKRRIYTVCKSINPAMLLNVRKAIITRINVCLEANGQFFEYLIK